MIVSPCISICKTDPSTGYCYGCGRTIEEKKIWKSEDTTDKWKKENLEKEKSIIKTIEEALVKTRDNLKDFFQFNESLYYRVRLIEPLRINV